jgi:small subunit ribosomal protein S10e
MLITKKQKEQVYNEIFKIGVLVIKKKKRNNNKKENEIDSLIVIKIIKGLLSKGFVDETFSWKVYYYTLNDNGVRFLRKILNLPPSVVPLTHKKTTLDNI